MNTNIGQTNKGYLFLGGILYFLLLFWADLRFLTTHYEYSGFIRRFEIGKFLLSLFTICLLFVFLKRKFKSHSVRFYQYMVIFIVLIPLLVHFSITANYYYYFVGMTSCLIVIFILVLGSFPYFHLFSLKRVDLVRILSVMVVTFVISILLMGGWQYFNLDLLKVYEYRRDAASNLPGVYAYFGSVISKIIIPVLIVLALQSRMKLHAFIAVVCAVLLFGLLAHKGTLFNPFVTILLYFFLYKKDVVKYILLGLLMVCLLSITDWYISEIYPNSSAGLFSSLFVRRVLMVPPLLTDFYIKFFNSNSIYYWCASKVSLGLLSCPYDVTAPFVIGKEYFGNIETSANIGWIGAGFSNMKLVGVLGYSILLGMLLRLISAFSKKLGDRLVISTSFLIVFTILTSTDIFTAFLSHGLIYLFLIYLLLPRITTND